MRRVVLAACVLDVGLTVLAAPTQAQRLVPPLPGITAHRHASGPMAENAPALPRPAFQSGDDRSAARTIAVHTAVGTGAGLLLGLVLSGASVGDDQTTVVLTWTAIGAAAGFMGGVVTWLIGREP